METQDQLPEPGTPLILGDGTVLDALTGMPVVDEPDELIEIPNQLDAVREITAVRRKVSDLPDIPQKMNTISVVLMYSLFGLPDKEIAIATGFSLEQVEVIKSQDAYRRLTNDIVENIMTQDEDDIRSMFRQGARVAARKMVSFVNHKSDSMAFAASKDILDRDGHRPVDVVEHRHRIEGGLAIEIIKTDKTQQLPPIDITPEK